MDGELSAILRGKLVPPGAGNFGRKISRYEDLWEETGRKPPMPFQPRRSTFWDHPRASQRPSLIWSHSHSLPAQYRELDKMKPWQSPVGAERPSSKPSQLATWLANIPTANSVSSQRSTRWNPMAKECYPSSSLDAPSLLVPSLSPAGTLAGTTDDTTSPPNSSAEYHPSPSPEPQQGNDESHPAPTHTRHNMRLAAVPAAMELPVPCPFQAPNLRSVPTGPRFPDYASSSLKLAASYPPVQLGPAQSYSLPANPNLPQYPVASAMNGLTSAARALLKWRMKNPNAGPVRQVSSQLTFNIQEQTRHQEEFELRKRNEKEKAAMRAGRAGLWKWR